ncbi:LOW QUALITY PROTEIN: uncharacterized protein PAF06_007630 [Gastrophryne carolinensis]
MITILYKHKGERNELKNWRPISLLNVDYKILAKVLANRLRSVIGQIVNLDQTYGIPGRRIADSLALVRDTVHYIQTHNMHGALVSLDQEKAFDRVSHGFMSKVLQLFAECIRQNPEIRGITAPGSGRQEVKCSLYMDDLTVFCADQRSISALVQTCEDFGRASGAKVNCGKSEAMLFGKWQLTSPVPFNVKPDYIKILGVWFGKEGAALKSWEGRIAKMNQKFGLWSLRNLTIEGKTLVLRSEILPVLQYLAQAWPPWAKTRKPIAKAVFYFIWGSKMDRVKGTKLCKEPRHALSHFFLLCVWRKLGWAKDSSVPYAWNLPWFYKDIEDFILEHQLAGVKADLWKPKTVYRLIRAKDETEPILGLPLDTCRFEWKNVSSRRLPNQHKDLAWQAIQGGLPMRTFMHDRGLSRYRHCPLCVVCEETSSPIWDCSYAQALLDTLGSELKDCGVPRNAVTHCGILYGLFHGNFAEEEVERAWRLMNCFKDAIWWARNRFILRREWMKIEDCRRLIHSLLRDYSLMDFSAGDEEDDLVVDGAACGATFPSRSTRWKRYTINPLGFKWNHVNLTYRIVQFPSTLNKGDTEKAMEIAFHMWSKVSPLTFHQVPSYQNSDLSIGFYSWNHSDCWSSPLHPCFDGPNGELAHAFLPPRGEIHFDNQEFWALGPSRFSWKQGVWYNDLVQVAAHEIGHALGLWHSNDTSALMHPNATNTRTRNLAKDDILAVQRLYGCTSESNCGPLQEQCSQQSQCHPNCIGCKEALDQGPVSHKVKVKTLYIPKGEYVTFNCTNKKSWPRQRFSWYKNGSRLMSSVPGVTTSSSSSLVLQAQEKSKGRYTCVIRQGRLILGGRSWNLRVK